MRGETSFHLVLPSGASHEVFPDNTNGRFKIKLPERLSCKRGEWEVAMRSITYHNNWFNAVDAYVDVGKVDGTTERVPFPDGRYTSILYVLSALYDALASRRLYRYVGVNYSAQRGSIYMRMQYEGYTVTFSADLADMLGFIPGKKYEPLSDNGNIYPENESNMQTAYEQLYVYSNLCAERLVGDTSVPLLHNVPVRWSLTQTRLVEETIERPVYVPVESLDTDVVEIDIRRRDGKPVVFRGGRVVVAVHLRRTLSRG